MKNWTIAPNLKGFHDTDFVNINYDCQWNPNHTSVDTESSLKNNFCRCTHGNYTKYNLIINNSVSLKTQSSRIKVYYSTVQTLWYIFKAPSFLLINIKITSIQVIVKLEDFQL